ncbi:MAG: hypothetical protein U0625_07825 [Phycisphaerales bacterium]
MTPGSATPAASAAHVPPSAPTAPAASAGAAPAGPARTMPGRLEIAWTVSARAIGAGAGYGSGVLHLECTWDAGGGSAPRAACVRATLDCAGQRRPVELPEPCEIAVERRGDWTHLRIAASSQPLLQASFDHGTLVYCVGAVAATAGLPGGTYDAPTGILELYDS